MEHRSPYPFNFHKFIAALAYLLERCGPKTKLQIAKLLYLLDRRHFNLHGRPILGDRYYRLGLGPVPSLATDLIDELEDQKRLSIKPRHEDKALAQHFKIIQPSKKYPPIDLVRAPSYEVLSESERQALDWVIEKFGKMTARELVDFTHKHIAWKDTAPLQEISYSLFPKDDPDASKDIAEIAAMEQEERAELIGALSCGPLSKIA